jgi:hypothetical protein
MEATVYCLEHSSPVWKIFMPLLEQKIRLLQVAREGDNRLSQGSAEIEACSRRYEQRDDCDFGSLLVSAARLARSKV